MSTEPPASNPEISAAIWARLKLPKFEINGPPIQNANDILDNQLSTLDKLAVVITDKVGSMGFFLIILGWTVLWTGYNILATELPGLHWKSFDPFPAFVAYLLVSNVIQILLMPLIMVGQNLQGRHSETRAQLDFEINQKAEKEVMVILQHLEHNTDLLIQLMKHMDCRISHEEIRALSMEKSLAQQSRQRRLARTRSR
jgi:Predicted membrane protein